MYTAGVPECKNNVVFIFRRKVNVIDGVQACGIVNSER
jgi:hypothetical protein